MTKRSTYQEALLWASSLLASKQLNTQIARWMMLHLLQADQMKWFDYKERSMLTQEREQYEGWIRKVVDGHPYQYIIGEQDFYGRSFKVNSNVLIPRAETELLVEQTLSISKEIWSPDKIISGLDIGTGSGVIAITLDIEASNIEMTGIDISEKALQVAIHNGEKHHSQAKFIKGDLLQEVKRTGQSVDLIVSNPPYIPFDDQQNMSRNVLDFEPHLALFAEEEGLYFYKQILEQAVQLINRPGLISFEVGIEQAEQVVSMAKRFYPDAQCSITKDYQGIARNVFIKVS